MAYTYRQELTKFEYAICLAAALGYLMIHQQDPVGLVTFDTQIRAACRRTASGTQLGTILALLAEPEADRRNRRAALPASARGDDPRQEPRHALQRPADRSRAR